jgi:AcrR family transcriptional regulator
MNAHLLSVKPMSPRPRTVTDDAILEATGRIIGQLGPSRFTLADVGAAVGLSAATLLQRFGSKRGLLLALAGSSAGYVDACFAAIRASTSSPLDALVASASHMATMAESPETLANHLAFLQIDLSDPEFHALAHENAKLTVAGYRRLLDESVASGELHPCDTRRIARAVSAISGGSLIAWAITREGTAVDYLRTDLETLLSPYRRSTAGGSRGKPDRRSASGSTPAPTKRPPRLRRRG